ncbi:hypothetical protein GMRT_13117 [Giardia muris]|uniref:Uncharacterized protein n=1 Tax=Giardia muris TaxID=5742 RepID=A0A4Z1SXV4_GIAMU|nr:hypothetical protein GMRT_13117 [Giardia muris]|eukprot:TNJ30526.1 hypothetical protein GMRT_13117 [Giardia muris]
MDPPASIAITNAFSLLHTTLSSTSSAESYQAMLERLVSEHAAVNAELEALVKGQVKKAGSLLDLLGRAKATGQRAQADVDRCQAITAGDESIPPDALALLQLVGHAQASAEATQALFELVTQVPARAALLIDRWGNRSNTRLTFADAYREVHSILAPRAQVAALREEHLEKLRAIPGMRSAQLDQAADELANIASYLDGTFFKAALDFNASLQSYLVEKAPLQILDPSLAKETAEDFVADIVAQELTEEGQALKTWTKVVKTIFSSVIAPRYTKIEVSFLSRHGIRPGDAQSTDETFPREFLSHITEALKADFECLATHVMPAFQQKAPDVIVERYWCGLNGVQPRPCGDLMTSKTTNVTLGMLFNLPLVYVCAIHTYVYNLFRRTDLPVLMTPGAIRPIIGFAADYARALGQVLPEQYSICSYVDDFFFQNVLKGDRRSGLPAFYRSWLLSLTYSGDPDQVGTVALDRTTFCPTAPFAPSTCALPAVFEVHKTFLATVSNVWEACTTDDKDCVLDRISRKHNTVSTIFATGSSGDVRTLFFTNAFSLEEAMQAVLVKYRQRTRARFFKACSSVERGYPRDLASCGTTNAGAFVTSAISSLFAVFQEQMSTIDGSTELGEQLMIETYRTACAALEALIVDILGNACGTSPPINLQYLCGVTDDPLSFGNLFTSKRFWIDAKRGGLAPEDFAFMTDHVEHTSLLTNAAFMNSFSTGQGGMAPKDEWTKFFKWLKPLKNQVNTNPEADSNAGPADDGAAPCLWADVTLGTREYIALANDLESLNELLEQFSDSLTVRLRSQARLGSIGRAKESLLQVLDQATELLMEKLAFTIFDRYRSDYFSVLFTNAHGADLMDNLRVHLTDDIIQSVEHLTEALQHTFLTELSNLIPASYICALLWRYCKYAQSSQENRFLSVTFITLLEGDFKNIEGLLTNIGVRPSIVRMRVAHLMAFSELRTPTLTTERLCESSKSISGAALAAYLLLHWQITREKFQALMSNSPEPERLDFFRSSPIDRALYRGPVAAFNFVCNQEDPLSPPCY